jgi:aminopeptidase N
MSSLTRSEAVSRASLLEVTRYDVFVDMTGLLFGPELRSVSTVTFTCRQPGADTFIDCAAQVVGATINGQRLQPPSDDRLALTHLAESNVLRVESVQADTRLGQGVHRSVDPADGEVFVWTSFEPDAARYVWACFDQPDLKAPHQFTVSAPAQWTVVSNAGDPQVETADGTRRWRFPATPRLSPYNTVINAGPFHEIRRQVNGYDLGILSRPSMARFAERDAEEIFTLTAQGLRFFGERFGMPFPQRKLDHVFMPEFGGAMENYGCITWSDDMLRRSTPTRAERDQLASYLLHELAHMWFGNVVTMRWWDDLWLNEAFAELASNWAAERATSHTDAWAAHLASEKLRAYLADQGPGSHPIREPVDNVAQAGANFDAITYAKGASVLQQLMAYVGEEQFCIGMQAYFAQHSWGNTTLQDLMEALAASSGRDLDRWRSAWLETAGTDGFTVTRDGDRLQLTAETPSGKPRPHVLTVGTYRRHVDRLERTAQVSLEPTGRVTTVEVPAGADMYLVNDEDLTFANIRPDPASRQVLLQTAARLPTPISRGVAVATVRNLLVNGEASAAEVVRCLTAVVAAETTPSMLEPFLNLAGDVAEEWSPEAERTALTAEVAGTCRDLADDVDRRHVALRGLARTARDLDEVAWLQDRAGNDVDLHWRALRRKAELGGQTAGEVARMQDSDPDPDAAMQALTVRAATPEAIAKQEVWQALAVDRTVPLSSFIQVARAFWRPGQDHVLAPFAQRYLDHLTLLRDADPDMVAVSTSRLFPIFTVDEAFIRTAQDAAKMHGPVVQKTLISRADVITRMLRSRG